VKGTRNLVVDPRRAEALFEELRQRARAWIPGWEGDEDAPDVVRALLQIAARFGSEVTERLDRMQEKNSRGLLDWLGFKPRGAQPARMPVVFKMADASTQAVLATRPIKLQAQAQPDADSDTGTRDGSTVVFETEVDVLVSPAGLDMVVAADPTADAYFLPAPGLKGTAALEDGPTQWTLLSFAENGATQLQLDPELGLASGLVLSLGGREYRITAVDRSIVTIDPPLEAADGLDKSSPASAVQVFAPFSPTARNRQLHAVYIGDENLLNIEAAASIVVKGFASVPAGTRWEYWGKVAPTGQGAAVPDTAAWHELTVPPDDNSPSSDITLVKDKGSVEPLEIGGKQSRWIRASVATVSSEVPTVDELRLAVNCDTKNQCRSCPDPALKPGDGPVTEGFYNSNPLVVSQPFYPFGQEPRQFDSFYLGCEEAFSKKGAAVRLCFDMTGPQVGGLAAVQTAMQGPTLLFGVGKDGSLHVLKFDSTKQFGDKTGLLTEVHPPVQPPTPQDGGIVQTVPRIRLEAGSIAGTARVRPAAWRDSLETYAAVWSGTDVWIWHEASLPTASGWLSYGRVGPNEDPKKLVQALATFIGPAQVLSLAAVRDGSLFVAPAPTAKGSTSGAAAWQRGGPVGKDKELISLASVCDVKLFTPRSGISPSEELVAVASNGSVYARAADSTWRKIPLQVDPDVFPAAVRISRGDLIVVAKGRGADTLVVCRSDTTSGKQADERDLVSLDQPLQGKNVDLAIDDAGRVAIIASVGCDDQSAVVTWIPSFGKKATEDNIFYTTVPAMSGVAADSPVFVADHLIVPRSPRDVFTAPFEPRRQAPHTVPEGKVGQAIIGSKDTGLAPKDSIVAQLEGQTEELAVVVVAEAVSNDNQVLYRLRDRFSRRTTRAAAFKTSKQNAAFKGKIDGNQNLVLDDKDKKTNEDDWVVLNGSAFRVKHIDASQGANRVAELSPKPTVSGDQLYWPALVAPGSLSLPVITLTLTPQGSADWPPNLRSGAQVLIPASKEKKPQQAKAFSFDASGQPVMLALINSGGAPVPRGDAQKEVSYSVNVIEDFIHQLSDESTNPDLSWEYWNGTGWWKLSSVTDATGNLKTTGTICFTVPDDFGESDWAGRTNYWIRARLVGGDYGREVVGTIPGFVNGVSGNVVARSTDGIHAPYVLTLQLSYSICSAVLPKFVLTDDSGTTTDQSAANRTPGAIVQAFIPLSTLLGSLDRVDPVTKKAPPVSPALYFGFTKELVDGPLNLLLLANEHNYDQFAPATIEVLRNGHFEPVTAQDGTRTVGETGMVTVDVPLATTATTLFGQARHWMRLRPRGATSSQWKPELTGAFFNAAWATAAETQELELLGSSDGGPGQRFLLARPPVMDKTLELRVLEPLGEEEREQLSEGDEYRDPGEKRVRSDMKGHPGDWVLWDLVTDPLDEDPSARCYSLDESTGEVVFGDSTHGRVPPIGRDAIMAASYRRSESSAANRVEAWADLNLITPVDGVESAFAPVPATGGSDSDTPERVMARGAARLRYRERAVTGEDLQDLALDWSPEIAQAKALMGPTGVRLIVVMRGSQPVPGSETLRELRSMLLSAASPILSTGGRLSVEPPILRRFGVAAAIDTADLSASGRILKAARANLLAFFDPATGGTSGTGWLLGLLPQQTDIAASVLDIADLQVIHDVSIFGLDVQPLPGALRPNELAWLPLEGIQISIQLIEASL
jgi:hypothetical protein